jgi:ribosomal protein L11 methyltransferase
MPWLEMRCHCDAAIAEAFSDALLSHGALSVSVEDADAGSGAEKPIFGEPGSAPGQVWNRNRVVALLEAGDDAAAMAASAAADCAIAVPTIETSVVEDQDWVRQTQAQFDPIRISKRLWIVPTWHAAPDPDAIVIRLDPGLAFGTGSHPTTRLCLRWLDACGPEDRSVVDYGCGSGILAIAAARLGAGHVVATDIDPQALLATQDNVAANACAVEIVDTGAISLFKADIVVANILTNPLKVLAPVLVGLTKPGGRLTLSGILETQESEVIAAYAPLIHLRRFECEDGWTCVTGTKPSRTDTPA